MGRNLENEVCSFLLLLEHFFFLKIFLSFSLFFRAANSYPTYLFVKYYGIYQHPETREKFLITELLSTSNLEDYNAGLESALAHGQTELNNLKDRLKV